MRRRVIALVIAVAATVAAGSAGGASTGSASIKIRLPAPNSVQFTLVHFKSAKPFTVSAKNAKQLGSPAFNTQAIVTWRKKNGGYDLMAVIHRFTPVNGRRLARASEEDFLELFFKSVAQPTNLQIINSPTPCTTLLSIGLLDDQAFEEDGWSVPENIVPAFDTAAEEQLDTAGAAKCPGAEKPDGGNK